jgi:hypothetical protein
MDARHNTEVSNSISAAGKFRLNSRFPECISDCTLNKPISLVALVRDKFPLPGPAARFIPGDGLKFRHCHSFERPVTKPGRRRGKDPQNRGSMELRGAAAQSW